MPVWKRSALPGYGQLRTAGNASLEYKWQAYQDRFREAGLTALGVRFRPWRDQCILRLCPKALV